MLPRGQISRFILLLAGALAANAMAAAPARAQGKLEARFTVTLAGIPIGKGSWVINVGASQYSAAASGVTTGLMRVFTGGEGTSAARGTISNGRPMSAVYASTIKSRRDIDEIRLKLDNGNLKEISVNPPQDKLSERVPLKPAHERGILDPMTATILHVPGNGDLLAPASCQRKLSVFDGRLRYDLQLAYKRMERVQADKGYTGPVLVCAVYFTPIAGYIPSRRTIRYLSDMRDMEVWLAPIAGTRVLVPFRAQGPTLIGQARLQADQFVTVASPIRASIGGAH